MLKYLYFDRSILNKYRTNSHLYILDEDDIGGELHITEFWVEEKQTQFPYIDLSFAFKKLIDNTVCIAIPEIFFERKIAKSEQNSWLASIISKPEFVDNDPEFIRWHNRYINGSWEEEDGPKKQIESLLKLINAVTSIKFKGKFFKHDKFNLVNYPVAENNEQYTLSITNLYRLIIDEMNKDLIISLADFLNIPLTDKSKRLNSLKEILPTDLTNIIHGPINGISKKRKTIHGIRSKGTLPFPAFDTFRSDLKNVSSALNKLKEWFEEITNLNAESCMNRLESLSLFPQLDEKYCHEGTRKSAKMMEGKRINKVEYGATKKNESSHRSEAINIYFDDGTAITIRIGSNASEIAYKYDDLKISDIHTDIMLFWIDKLKSNEKK